MSGHSHGGHSHGLTAGGAHRGRLVAALVITLSVMVIEVVGALFSGSLALLADAAHMLSDSVGLGIAILATWLAARPPTERRTFGWKRVEVLAALVNGVIVAVIGVLMLVEGTKRLMSPADVDAPVMLVAAVLGLAANVVALRLLSGGQKESLNVRGAYLEVLGDMLGSIAVIVAAVVIALTGFMAADGLAGIVIGCLILPRAYGLLRAVALVLLEATPAETDLGELRRHMEEVDGVVEVEDLHAWTITSGSPVLTAHVQIHPLAYADGSAHRILTELNACIGEHFDIRHSTLQLEPAGGRHDHC
ncbi:cation transporter [Arthrobacter sp. RIT-PI-e]|uniref:cation diffusion facilitator family transporter n=1 Tax=Arthrobacter sp. RIT-PI-e TaxID=1681197 RepID=UPI000675CA49|nr:cation diffusion facilitator family transporter [Arthrobacter sp. RIT-PI-e]KNC18411.1 cation transporter [Arthrobacter sp. RIT-PI-e]